MDTTNDSSAVLDASGNNGYGPERREDRRGRGWERAIFELRGKYGLLCLTLLLLGGLLNFWSETTKVTFDRIDIPYESSISQEREYLAFATFPKKHFIFQALGYVLFSMGISLFITLFITNEIERHERRKWEQRDEELKHSIATTAFETIYKKVIPEEIFQVVRSDLLLNMVIRKEAVWDYRFKIQKDGGVVCEHKFSYSIQNVGVQRIKNPLDICFTNDENSNSELLRVVAKCRGKEIAKFDSRDPSNLSGLSIEHAGEITKVNFDGYLDPGADNSIFITTLMKIEYRNIIQEVFFTKLPIINGSVIIRFPVEFNLCFYPSTSSKFDEEDDHVIDGYRTKVFIFRGGVLPNQGFAINLNRVREKELDTECLKKIAGKFTHKLNNTIGDVVNVSEALLTFEKLDSRIKTQVEKIYGGAHRTLKVIEDLERFEEHEDKKFEHINLSLFIQEILVSRNLQELCGGDNKIDLITNLDTETLDIRGNKESIGRMLMVIFRFLTQKDGEGEKNIRIDVENIYIDRPLTGYNNVEIGEYVVLRVINKNLKIDKETLKESFQPFSSHHQTGDLSGLELTIASNEIHKHTGYCKLDSGKDGTVFELFFPIIRQGVLSSVLTIPISKLMGSKERILVVDDEKRELGRAKDLLIMLDYQPTLANSGEEAIRLVKMEKGYDLVLLDMIMPNGLNGAQTYEQIININPYQKAIIVSGYPEDQIREEIETAQKLGAGRYIKKPYTFQKLGEAIKTEIKHTDFITV